MTKIVVLGTGGHGLELLELAAATRDAASTDIEIIGFLDDDPAAPKRVLDGRPVLGPLSLASSLPPEIQFLSCLGSPRSFRRKAGILAGLGIPSERYATLVHPSAVVSRHARLGHGVVIFPHVTVGAGVQIGDHVMILPGCVLSHDVFIGDCCLLAATVALAGGVRVERDCYLGLGALVRGGVTLGAGCLIGMGAVVLHDVPPEQVMIGNPARRLR